MKFFISLIFSLSLLFAEYDFIEPKPSFDEPRKVLFQVSDSDLSKVEHIIGSIYNIQKEYPTESLDIRVVMYGPGMRVLKKDYDKRTLQRIKSLMDYGYVFVGCKNTMDTMNWNEKDFIEDIEYVQAGLVEVIERKNQGYVGIIAY